MQYHEAGLDLDEKTPEIAALKQELSRMMIGTHPEFSRLVDAYMTLDDLFAIRDRLIGSGRIGGKAAGMLLARRILVTDPGETDFAEVLEAHDSFYIGSDVFFTFLVNNDLFRMRLQLSRATSISHEEFAEVEKRFLAGSVFPGDHGAVQGHARLLRPGADHRPLQQPARGQLRERLCREVPQRILREPGAAGGAARGVPERREARLRERR